MVNKFFLQIICVSNFLLFSSLSAIAHDRVVVVPLNARDGDTHNFHVVTSANGRVWMDRNLGASQVASSLTDVAAYGDMYQWGRLSDAHERRVSAITTTRSTKDTPGHGVFISTAYPQTDWKIPKNDKLWQGANGTNNPCPRGFRLPTAEEWDVERASWSSDDITGGFSSPLKLVATGYRQDVDGLIYFDGVNGFYYSSTVDGASASYLYLSTYTDILTVHRAYGMSVRCIKD